MPDTSEISFDYTRIHPDEYATVRYFASIHEDEDNDLDDDDEDNDLDDEAGYRKYKKLGEMMQNSEKTMNDSPEIFHPTGTTQMRTR